MTTATYYLDAKGRQTIDKDPGAKLDYVFDWTDFLAANSDTIASATATGVGCNIIGNVAVSGAATTAWVSGGVLGTPATLNMTITTAAGRIEPMTVQLKITPKVI